MNPHTSSKELSVKRSTFAQTQEYALLKLKCVLEIASDYGLEFNFAKCQFLRRKIEFCRLNYQKWDY